MKKTKNFFKKNWPVLSALIISALVYHVWLSFKIFTNADYWFNFPESIRGFANLSVWRYNLDFGGPDPAIWMLFGNFIPGIFGQLGFSSNIYDKFILFWPFIFIAPLSSFLLAKKILKNNTAALVSSFVYSFNTYFLAIATQGHFSLILAGVFAPFVLLFFITAMEESSSTRAIISALFLFLVGSYDFRTTYIMAGIISLYLIFFIIFIAQSKEIIKASLKNYFIFVAVSISLNIYWILPQIKMGTLAQNDVLSRDIIYFYLNLPRAMTLFHPFWTGGIPKWFEGQPVPIYFWLIPIFAFLGLWLNRKDKNIVFFALVSLLAIFLAKQTADPFGELYRWLNKHLPGFSAFREASKFYVAVALGYSILIGAFISQIWNNWKKNKLKIYGKYTLFILISGLFLWNTRPIITGNMGTMFVSYKISDDESKLRNWLLSQSDFSRILWVPSESLFSSFSPDHPKINIGQLNSKWENFIDNNAKINPLDSCDVTVLNQLYSNRLMNLASIRYIIADKLCSDNLTSLEYLQKIDVGTGDINVFENPNFRPHIYLTPEIETIHLDVPYKSVGFNPVSTSEYRIGLKNITGPGYLNFSESFHPGWKLRVGNFSWLDSIFQNNYFLPDGDHYQNDAGLNSFYLDPQKICAASGKCAKNPDGSFNLDLTLFFQSQSYLYLGAIISFLVLISALAYLLWLALSFKKNNKLDSKILR